MDSKTHESFSAPGVREAAAQTPPLVRAAMLAAPRRFGSVTLHPLSLDTLWLLEACGNPLAQPTAGAPVALTPLTIAQLIFTFAAPDEALEASTAGVATGELTEFDRAAFAFVRRAVPLPEVQSLGTAIAGLITEALAPAPQTGNPPAPAA